MLALVTLFEVLYLCLCSCVSMFVFVFCVCDAEIPFFFRRSAYRSYPFMQIESVRGQHYHIVNVASHYRGIGAEVEGGG